MFLFQLGSWQHSVSGDMEDPVVALVSTGWLHVAGPDGSEGATIVGDVDTLGNIDFGPLDLLAGRATGAPGMISYQREHVGWEFQWVFLETAVRHVMQFRTMPVSNPYRNVMHVHACMQPASYKKIWPSIRFQTGVCVRCSSSVLRGLTNTQQEKQPPLLPFML